MSLPEKECPKVEWGLVIHGGVGVLSREEMTEELEGAYLEVLHGSISAGFDAMRDGGSAVDGVVESIKVMEDSDLFNAGRGSNYTTDGAISMDASIMVGNTLAAGAVAGVGDVRHPIRLARHVMEDCPHVMLSGVGAEEFARQMGMGAMPEDYFFTERRWSDLQAAKTREASGSDTPNTVDSEEAQALAAGAVPPPELREKSGTVGAVALDAAGMLVAGTSTGGSANKKWGRIGDSPVIGSGTYAGSNCGVSCTGWGEYFIRNAVAHDIEARMAYLGESLPEAAGRVILETLESQRRGLGGVVAMDKNGQIAMPFNTQGMYRGWVNQDGEIFVDIY